MDFGALPPEINSGRMYLGPGPGTLLAASAGWESLAGELTDAASGYQSVIASLTDESWLGPTSMSMAAAVTPYISWMTATAAQCEQAAAQATAAAGLRNGVRDDGSAAADRGQPRSTHGVDRDQHFGQNTPAIMATEAEYSEMWAQDATAMYNYAASSASASTFSTFGSPPQMTNPGGLAGQAGAVAQTAGTKAQTMTAQLISSMPQTLQTLATPGASSGTGLSQAAAGTAASLGSSGASAPLSALSSLTGATRQNRHQGRQHQAGALSGLTSSLTSALGGNGAALTDVFGLAPIWAAWAAMVRGWVPTALDSVSTVRPIAGFPGRGLDYRRRGAGASRAPEALGIWAVVWEA